MGKRPLTGEPLSLDLANTRWLEEDEARDSLVTSAGTQDWLREVGLIRPEANLDVVRKNLIQSRSIIRELLEHRADERYLRKLNAVLAKGAVLEQLSPRGSEEVYAVGDNWFASWTCARNLVHLFRTFPGRIRRCANPVCVLYFLDATKNGTRRWCSMKTCGNRAKASRHYRRVKQR